MSWFFRVIAVAGLSAAIFCGMDAILLMLAHRSFWAAPDPSWVFKARVTAANFYLLCLIFAVGTGLLAAGSRWLKSAGMAFSAASLFIYAVSWTSFFVLDQFLDVEGLRFFIYNFVQILGHIAQTSPLHLALLLAIMVFVPAVVMPLYAWIVMGCFKDLSGARTPWVGVALLVCMGAAAALQTCPAGKRGDRQIIRNGLSPQAALAADLLTPTGNPGRRTSNLLMRWSPQITLAQFRKRAGGQIQAAPVIILVVESMTHSVLDDATVMPNVFKLKEDSLYFNHAFPPSNESDYAWPAMLSSQYPLRELRHHFYPRFIPYPRVLIYDILQGYGYKTAIFSAQNEWWSRMRNYLDTGHLDVLFDANGQKEGRYLNLMDQGFGGWVKKFELAGKLDDGEVVTQALRWLGQDAGERFLLIMNFQRPHFPYTWPDTFSPPFAPYGIDFEALFGKYPRSKAPIMKNRYNNALSYVDSQIGRLVHFLKERNLYDRSLIILSGDHGEAFYEKDMSCHGADLDDTTTRTGIVLKMPGNAPQGERSRYVQTIDIPPTITDILGIRPHPAFQGDSLLTQGQSDDHRPIFMSVTTTRAYQDAIVLDHWKYVADYARRRELLFDLDSDPKEKHNVVAEFPNIASSLRSQLEAWRMAQLEYYRDERKQKNVYAPKVVFGRVD